MIPESFIQDLLHRVDIVDLIDAHVPLKKAGANYAACCPFHNEKSPLHGQPEKAVLSLLRLRRARHGHRLPDGIFRPGLHRRRQGSGQPRRHAGTGRGRPPLAMNRDGPKITDLDRSHGARRQVLPRAAQRLRKSHRLPQGARRQRRDRPEVRHRLRAGWLAKPRRIFPRITTPRELLAAGLVIEERRRAGSTTASVTG